MATSLTEKLKRRKQTEARTIEQTPDKLCKDEHLAREFLEEETTPEVYLPAIPEENPFGDSGDELSAVDAIQKTIDPDPETLPLIANASNPRANAIGDTVTSYIRDIAGNKQAGIKELATFGQGIIRNCLKHQIGQQGKDNRAIRYLQALEARQAFADQQALSQGDKAFGKR